jgi:hypothetical protein
MEFDFDLFIDDFVNTIMYDIENTEGEKEFYRKNDIKETIESKLKEYEDNILAGLDNIDKEDLEATYYRGYDDGYEAALDEVSDSLNKIYMMKNR